MSSKVHGYEIVKTFKYIIEGLPHAVYGQISRDISTGRYEWSISHYYRPSESAAAVYHPSALMSDNINECESLLNSYVANFIDLDVTINEYF